MQNVLSGNPSGVSAPVGEMQAARRGDSADRGSGSERHIDKNVSQVLNDHLAISVPQNRPLLCTPHRSDVDDRRRRILPESLTDVVDP
jgi:hypothetical protein